MNQVDSAVLNITTKTQICPGLPGKLFIFNREFFALDHRADGIVRGEIEGLAIQVASGEHLLALFAPFAFWFAIGMTHYYQLPFNH